MERSRKKTLEQHVVGVATLGMPTPIKKVAGSRWGSRVFLLVAAILFGAGIINVQWINGRPQLQVDKERAQEVKQGLVSQIESAEVIKHEQASKFPRLELAEKPGESGLIPEVFGHGESPQDSMETPQVPRFGVAGEATDHLRDLSAKVLPKPSENQPTPRTRKLPRFR